MKIFEYKPIGGKLISISFNYSNSIFSEVKIYGDFFIFPEEAIEILEKSIEGKSYSELPDTIDNFLSLGIRFYGITKEDLIEVFRGAINEK